MDRTQAGKRLDEQSNKVKLNDVYHNPNFVRVTLAVFRLCFTLEAVTSRRSLTFVMVVACRPLWVHSDFGIQYSARLFKIGRFISCDFSVVSISLS